MKQILIISSSLRPNSNSDAMCDEFMRGAQDSGNNVEKLRLSDYKLNFCTGCDICSTYGKPCPLKDDALAIMNKMIDADIIVMATPLYFYAMSGQLKTLIDRCCGLYTKMRNKKFYFLVSAAENSERQAARAVENLQGFLDCLEGATIGGTLYGLGVWHAGEIKGNAILKDSYDMGAELQ